MAPTLRWAMTKGTHTMSGTARRCAGTGSQRPRVVLSTCWQGRPPAPSRSPCCWAATVLLTLSKMWQSVGAWAAPQSFPPAATRRMPGSSLMGYSAQHMVAQGALIRPRRDASGWGWLVVAAMFFVAAPLMLPVVGWAERTRSGQVTELAEPVPLAAEASRPGARLPRPERAAPGHGRAHRRGQVRLCRFSDLVRNS